MQETAQRQNRMLDGGEKLLITRTLYRVLQCTLSCPATLSGLPPAVLIWYMFSSSFMGEGRRAVWNSY